MSELSLRDIVRVPGRGIGRTVAIMEAGSINPMTTVELVDGQLWTGPAWVVEVVRSDNTNLLYRDGGHSRHTSLPDDGPCQICGDFYGEGRH